MVTVVVADCTFYKHVLGLIAIRVPSIKRNIYWKEIRQETSAEYLQARSTAESQGWQIKGITADGKQSSKIVFNDIPFQMCHFHQKKIITRYLTTRPKLQASIELKKLTNTLTLTDENTFSQRLDKWYEHWSGFLKEKTVDPENLRKWHYTHKRIRSAYYSLKNNLPYLFTYQKYPKLNMPNTTNSLDGYFSHLKDLTKLHRGLNKYIKYKMISEVMSKIDPKI